MREKRKSDTVPLEDVNGSAVQDEEKVAEEYYPGQEFEGKFGWCGFTPDWLQFCNNPVGFLFIFSIFLITQGMLLNGMFNVAITTLERRFSFQSSEMGLVAVSYDIGYFIFGLFITYYANRGHRPRMLAMGSVLLGLGTLLFSLPHFTTGLYEYGSGVNPLCDPSKEENCDSNEELHDYLYLFIFSMLLQGVGCVPLYTISYAVLEDSLPKNKSPIYISIANAMALVGPIIGYLLGGFMLTVYVDFDDADSTGANDLTLTDPRWVGAWWVGHLLGTAMCFGLVTVPMFGFPRQFPGSAKIRAERESEVHANAGAEITEREDFGKSARDMPRAILAMLKNPTYVFTVLGGCAEAFIISGFTAFLPKIIQNNYNATAAEAALYAGAIAIPGGVFGNVIAGLVISKYNMRAPALLKYVMCCITCVIILSPIGLYHCSDPVVAGVTVGYNESVATPSPSDLSYACNANCKCSEEYFTPVCAYGVGYFSACHAGCSGYDGEQQVPTYTSCNCIVNTTTGRPGAYATYGLCEEPCDAIIVYILVFFVITLLNFMLSTPAQLVLFRCVPDSQRSFAIGLQVFMFRALGSIPGPIAFGAIIDSTCVLWQNRNCGRGVGSCYIYSSHTLAIDLMSVAIAFQATAVVCFYLAMRFYKLPTEGNKEKILEVYRSLDSETLDTGSPKQNAKTADSDSAVASHDNETQRVAPIVSTRF